MSEKKQIWAEVLEVGGEGVPDGEFYPKKFKEGDVVTGDLAEAFIKLKLAKKGKGDRPADKGEAPGSVDNSDLQTRIAVLEDKELPAALEDRLKALEEVELPDDFEVRLVTLENTSRAQQEHVEALKGALETSFAKIESLETEMVGLKNSIETPQSDPNPDPAKK